jgi:phosphatidylglycerophosphatase C
MGTDVQFRHQASASGPIVAFDFDGTLTCRDSFVAFLAWRAGRARATLNLPMLLSALLTYGADRDRGALKARVARRFLGRIARERLEADAERFAEISFAKLIRPDALTCWRDWRRQGARLFIVTASPEITVAPFAARLGADGLIGTRLCFSRDGLFTGDLDGPNCRGPEKVTRLRARLGDDFRLAAAYGDTSGDREMLAIAQTSGFKIFKARP